MSASALGHEEPGQGRHDHVGGYARDGLRPRSRDRVVSMDGGVVVEEGVAEHVISSPTRGRTKEFLRRVLDPTHIEIAEALPPTQATPARWQDTGTLALQDPGTLAGRRNGPGTLIIGCPRTVSVPRGHLLVPGRERRRAAPPPPTVFVPIRPATTGRPTPSGPRCGPLPDAILAHLLVDHRLPRRAPLKEFGLLVLGDAVELPTVRLPAPVKV